MIDANAGPDDSDKTTRIVIRSDSESSTYNDTLPKGRGNTIFHSDDLLHGINNELNYQSNTDETDCDLDLQQNDGQNLAVENEGPNRRLQIIGREVFPDLSVTSSSALMLADQVVNGANFGD